MSARALVFVMPLLALACPRREPARPIGPSSSDAGQGELEREAVRRAVAALSKDTERWLEHVNEQLWTHWTTGAALGLDGGVRTVLLEPPRRAALRRALELQVDSPRALGHLERFIANEALLDDTAPQREAVAALEATLTFPFEGKEVRWRDLQRLLANDQSALKRKALWAASAPAAQQLARAIAERDAALASRVDGGDVIAWWCQVRELDAKELKALSEQALAQTDAAWATMLDRLNETETKLPRAALTRADLPRLLRVSPDVDKAFPAAQLGARGVATLRAVGFGDEPGLTLELTDRATKRPLPLTIAPRPRDVRVSFRPVGGFHDQAQLLDELGAAVALSVASGQRFEFRALGDTSFVQVAGALFETVLADAAWLEAQQVQPALRAAIVETFETQRLFQLRRAAALSLAQLDRLDASQAAALMTRALGVTHTASDFEHVAVESSDGLRSGTRVRVLLTAQALHRDVLLGGAWWSSPDTAARLRSLFEAGTSRPVEQLRVTEPTLR